MSPQTPHPDEPYYCSQQIEIPPQLPDCLKQFTKAAIRTQPKDVLIWAASYFNALANGQVPPVKERLEMKVATNKTDTGLTPGLIAVLHKQLGSNDILTSDEILEKWLQLALPKEQFDELLRLGGFKDKVKWLHFVSMAASAITEDIAMALKLICETLSVDLPGGAARIPFVLWKDLYSFLAQVDGGISQEMMAAVYKHVDYDVEKQGGMIQPRNFLSADCPPLHPAAAEAKTSEAELA